MDLPIKQVHYYKEELNKIMQKSSTEMMQDNKTPNILINNLASHSTLPQVSKKLIRENALSGFDNQTRLSNEMKEFEDKIEELLQQSANLGKLIIPTVVFTGGETELATVFQNLNRGGKKLSKYQVFAAQWNHKIVKLPDNDSLSSELLKIVIDRYDELDNSRNIEIKDYNPMELKSSREISFAEFCYATGVLIVRTLPSLFSVSDELLKYEDVANEIGYPSIAIAMGLSNRKLHELINSYDLFTEANFITDFLDKVKTVYESINQIFKYNFKLPGQSSKFETKGKTNFMILSYFASLWHTQFQLINDKLVTIPRYRNDHRLIKENIVKYFLVDQATSYWSGTGDSKIDEIVINKTIRYKKPILKDRFEMELFNWHEERSSLGNIQFDYLSKSIITYIANKNQNYYSGNTYQFEHVVARSKLINTYKPFSIPGGSLGNIMLLERRLNNSKKEGSLYDASFENEFFDPEFLKVSNYPGKNEIDEVLYDLENLESQKDLTKMFILNRGKYILNNLTYLLYKE